MNFRRDGFRIVGRVHSRRKFRNIGCFRRDVFRSRQFLNGGGHILSGRNGFAFRRFRNRLPSVGRFFRVGFFRIRRLRGAGLFPLLTLSLIAFQFLIRQIAPRRHQRVHAACDGVP